MARPTIAIRSLALSLGLSCLIGSALAADGPGEIVTDRPDRTESSVTVAPGYAQLETGWTLGRDDAGSTRTRTHELPGSLLRIGVFEALELRVGWTGFIFEEARGGGQTLERDGAGDAELGVKVHLAAERGARPDAALIVATSLPAGAGDLSSGRFDPNARLSLSHELTDRASLGYNLGIAFASEADGSGGHATLSDFVYTVAAGFGLGERLGAFAELFGEVPASAKGRPRHSADGGLTYLIRSNLQLDAAAGIGLSDGAPDWFVGVGVSVRFPY